MMDRNTMTRLPPTGRKVVALGVSAAILVYSCSLVVQRAIPAVKDALAVAVMNGVKATYYVRVVVSLLLGAVAALIGPRCPVSERVLAVGTAIAIAIGVALVCAFP